MDLSEARTAVAKIMKDYQPLVRLAEALNETEAKLQELGNLEAAKAKAEGELKAVLADKAKAEADLGNLRKEGRDAQSALDKIKAALSSVKL